MTLRVRLALIFIGMMLLTLLITTFLSWYELIDQPARENPVESQKSMTWRLAEIVIRGAGPIIVLALIAWWLTQRMLRPIESLTKATNRLKQGRYGEQITLQGGKHELAQLTTAFNAMSLQIADSFKSIREFTLHASHELKTPLTLLRASMERKLPMTAVGSPERDEMASQLNEVHRLTDIVDSLAMLTKGEAGLAHMEKQTINLHTKLAIAREEAEALSEDLGLTVVLERCDEVSIIGDRFRIRQLLLILIDNAVKYNQPNGWIRLGLRSLGTQAEIQISNSGPGMSEEQQAHVFDRFFRGSESQASGIEGSGLGLSIARWIVQAHDGTITFVSSPAETNVTITLPKHY